MLTLQLRRWGNSSAIRIPSSVMNQLSWGDDDLLRAEVTGDKLIISSIVDVISLDKNACLRLSEAGINVSSLLNDVLKAELKKLNR